MGTPPHRRVLAIDDIHGCSTALAALMEAVRPGPDDALIALGDVIDYGPDSRGVVGQLKALRGRTNLTLLTGNHEEMLFAVLDQDRDLYQSLLWLMEAQKIADPPGIDTVVAADGTTAEVFRLGRDADPVPECPWADARTVARRNAEVRPEVESHRRRE